MMEDATAYVRMEEERDQLRLKMDETARKCLLLGFAFHFLRVRRTNCFLQVSTRPRSTAFENLRIRSSLNAKTRNGKLNR